MKQLARRRHLLTEPMRVALSALLVLLAAAPAARAVPLPKEVGPLRTAYDTSLASLDSEMRDALGRLGKDALADALLDAAAARLAPAD